MTQEHPITPPPELFAEWIASSMKTVGRTIPENDRGATGLIAGEVAIQAARWGADQELEACCEWIYKLMDRGLEWSMDLRAARRPKPPSLKEQALLQLDTLNADLAMHGMGCDLSQIRRALEQLND